ncbi:MAG TPA: DMT family transporter [Caldithrix abyssi]|uniref:DMT family transporter n=1 Tax=Caldithrix abyssi TaxID=187145 RepID=A0A7V5UF05_CALAY|nr:DMT family transporter [Caldithrix abyssi]
MKITRIKADLGLLSVTFFWGTTFILSKLLLREIPLPVYLFIRLTIAALALGLFSLRYLRQINGAILLHGTVLGALLYFSYFFQMWGIQWTSASNAGFITGLSVVLVPVFGFLFFRQRSPLIVVLGVILAVTGLLLLTGAQPLNWNKGDLLVLVCAVSVAFHVIYTGKYAPLHNVYLLTAIELIVVAILAALALPFGDYQWPDLRTNQILLLIYLGLFGTVFTFLMQTSMQRFTTAARTALIFAMEPVFAALFAFLIAGETLTLLGWVGGLLIVLGMIVSEMPISLK